MITLKNLTTGQEIVLNYDDMYLIKKVDWGTIAADHITTKFFGQIGVNTDRVNMDGRIVAIDGAVKGGTNEVIKARKKKLSRLINPGHDIELLVNGYKITGRPRSTVAYGIEENENNDQFCVFRIEFFCGYPLFMLEKIKNIVASMWMPNFEFDLEIPEDEGIEFEYKVPNVIVNARNDGDVIAPMMIEFVATGAVVNPYIVDVGTQHLLRVNVSLQKGDKVIIDTDVSRMSFMLLSGGVYTNIYGQRDKRSDPNMVLQEGDNLLRFGADEGEEMLDVNILCYESFWECDWIA